MRPAELPQAWRREAENAKAIAADMAARVFERCATDLESAVASERDEPLTLAESARESGLSAERLRHRVAAGEIPNAGRKGAPRIRRGDLPTKRKSEKN